MASRRKKSVTKVQKLLGSGGTCRMYGFGVTGPEPRRSMYIIVGGVVAGCLALLVLTWVLV